jgi:alpha-glucosidase
MQYHIFSKNQPENLAFLERMRGLLDEYEARAMVGEVGESHHPIRMMGEYTSGRRLQKAYSFEMLGDRFDAAHFRGQVEAFFEGAPKGWPTWAFSNHDVRRHVSRWARHGIGQEPLAKLASALLLSLEGSICIYQGEELGQTETELEVFELTDPQGINFWPEPVGRDGCRTPMVWDAGNASSGFSTGRPWLPIKGAQAARHAAGQAGDPESVLAFYRTMLKLRRDTEELRTGRSRFFDVEEPVLAFTRGDSVLCVFNLSPERRVVKVTGAGALAVGQGAEHGDDGVMILHPNGFAIMEAEKDVTVSDLPPETASKVPPKPAAVKG